MEPRAEWAGDVAAFLAAASAAERDAELRRVGALLDGERPELTAALVAAEPMVTRQICKACEQDISDEAREAADRLMDEVTKHAQASPADDEEEFQLLLAPIQDKAWMGALGLQLDAVEECNEPWSCMVRVPSRESHKDWRQSRVPALVWPPAPLCAELLLGMPSLARGRSVLELGCGSHGVVARAAAHVGAASVLATDVDA